MGVAGRLSEAMVETAAAGSGNVRENAVDGDAAVFVGVETLVEEVAEEAAVLGDAFGDDARGGSDGVRGTFCVRGKIAEGGEAEAGDDGIFDDVDVFVDAAGGEAAVEMDGAIAGRDFAVDGCGELPFRTRDGAAFGFSGISNGKRIARIVGLGDRIFRASDAALHQMAERDFVHLL